MRIAALSVITVPSSSTSVGTCARGFTAFIRSNAGLGCQLAASTHLNGCPAKRSAASTAAAPEPLAPYSVHIDRYFLSSGQTLLDAGRNACSAGMVALSL